MYSFNTTIENLKDSITKALVCALEQKNIEAIDTLYNVYSTVRSIKLNNESQMDFEYNLYNDLPNSYMFNGGGSDYIYGNSSEDVIKL